jgi:L-iditol 2-dehydrogenase
MKIAELRAPGTFAVIEVPRPEPGPGEVLVEVAVCGVCASELELWTGSAEASYPLRIGHEVSGCVAALGPAVTGMRVGDPVAVWTGGGGYAEYVAVRQEYCRPSGGVPLEQALAEPVACAANAVELADVRLADDVVIIGAGFMGQLVLQLVRLRGARRVIVADTRPDALELASRHGATATVRMGTDTLTEVVDEATAGAGADITFEVTGRPEPLEIIGDVTRMSGKLVLVGYHQGAPRAIPLAQWNWKAFQLVNAHFREEAVIMRGLTIGMRLLVGGRLDLASLVSHAYPLDDIDAAFRAAVEKPAGFVKAVVRMADRPFPRP